MAPTPLPYSALYRHVSMIIAFSISLIDRLAIGAIAGNRLLHYRRAGLLRRTEIKVCFHVCLLATLPFLLPYYVFCEVHFDYFQCWVQHNERGLFRTSWVLYELFRMGLPLQLAALSMTVLTWCDFLHMAEDGCTNRNVPTLWNAPRNSAPRNLRVVLLVVNSACMGFTTISAFICMADPYRSVDLDNLSRLSSLTYMAWFALDASQLALVLLLMRYGWLLRTRIQATVVFDDRDRADMLQRLNVVLGIMISCLTVEVVFRTILSWQWLTNADHQTALTSFVQWNPILWQFTGYILPYDVVTFCLLYLMRATPQKRHISVQHHGPALSEDFVFASPRDTRSLLDQADKAAPPHHVPSHDKTARSGRSVGAFRQPLLE